MFWLPVACNMQPPSKFSGLKQHQALTLCLQQVRGWAGLEHVCPHVVSAGRLTGARPHDMELFPAGSSSPWSSLSFSTAWRLGSKCDQAKIQEVRDASLSRFGFPELAPRHFCHSPPDKQLQSPNSRRRGITLTFDRLVVGNVGVTF